MAPMSDFLPPVVMPREEGKIVRIPGEPLAGSIMAVILSMASITVLTLFIAQRSINIKVWRRLPYVVWLVFAIYIDSYMFVFATAILQLALGVNTSLAICSGAIFLCLVCYITTKVFIYLFLVEKAYIIRGTTKPRLKSKLYLFNSFGMVSVYVVVAILNFIFRITKIENGVCIIGMEDIAMIPLISFDAVVNVYLTILFLIPLKNLYSFRKFAKTPANIRLRTVAFRTFIGAVCTLVTSIVNLSVLMALGGEPGWVCLMCCNSDILFSAVVIQWITSKDNAGTSSSSARRAGDTYDDRNENFSPQATNSKGGLDDIVDISLSSTSRSNRVGSQSSDQDPITGGDKSQASGAPGPGAVVITTTIKRESKPSGTIFDDDSEGFIGGRVHPTRPQSVAAEGRPEGYIRQSARTKITGGAHR